MADGKLLSMIRSAAAAMDAQNVPAKGRKVLMTEDSARIFCEECGVEYAPDEHGRIKAGHLTIIVYGMDET